MLMNVSKKIELVANVAIIVVSCLLATAFVRNYFFTKFTLSQSPQQAGSQPFTNPSVSSLDIVWKQTRPTLVLAISRTKAMKNKVNVKKVM